MRLERADHMRRKKEIHERQHPETKHGGAGVGRSKVDQNRVLGSEDSIPTPSFVEKQVAETAQAGKPMARQTVERLVRGA